jgi:hypothetical protein
VPLGEGGWRRGWSLLLGGRLFGDGSCSSSIIYVCFVLFL